jgi:hypothetical protein
MSIKQMQLTKRKAVFGRPAPRANSVCWRFAADLQRWADRRSVAREDGRRG